ncbi:MAG: alpha-ketoacid dehydrogenase subunit beta [Candidatus Omnitrophica bacterium]|nr:alpha-ketoacid dehydrogenase subunit beta [Candidatus Omnitrophota bacterium]
MSWDKAPIDLSTIKTLNDDSGRSKGRMATYREAIREALYLALKEDKRAFIFGEGVDDAGGVFGTTLDLHKEFGRERVFDTPLCENTLTGIAIGSSLGGLRPVLVHMRTDFMLLTMDQLINHAAKWKYMFGGKVSVPMVVRAIIGGGWGSAAQHSQPIQALFTHVPGLKVVMPSCAYDAKGLLLSSIAGDSPVIFIEHRWLYDHKEAVPKEAYFVPLGKAVLRREGRDLTVIADSFMVTLAQEAAMRLGKDGIDIEVLDLRTVRPLDHDLILASVKKTGRALVLDFGYKFGGISSEISSFLMESAFKYLKSPVRRLTLPDTPTPCSPALEKAYYPDTDRVVLEAKKLLRAD